MQLAWHQVHQPRALAATLSKSDRRALGAQPTAKNCAAEPLPIRRVIESADLSFFCYASAPPAGRFRAVPHLLTDLHDVFDLLARYWGGVVPEKCRQAHQGEEWNCFFGYRVFPSIKSRQIKRTDLQGGWRFEIAPPPYFAPFRPGLCGPVAVRRGPVDRRQHSVDRTARAGRPVALHPKSGRGAEEHAQRCAVSERPGFCRGRGGLGGEKKD